MNKTVDFKIIDDFFDDTEKNKSRKVFILFKVLSGSRVAFRLYRIQPTGR